MSQPIDKTESKILRLKEKKRKMDVQIAREEAKLKERRRKERTRRLIEVGGLAERAGILDSDSSALLAGLIQLAELCSDEPTFTALKQQGEAILRE